MSREFVPVVTDEMIDFAATRGLADYLAHPDFQRQLRAWAAEEMRGLVPVHFKPDLPIKNFRLDAGGYNRCRAETLANIEKWEQENG